MTNFLAMLKSDRITPAFAVLIGGVLTLRYGAPPLPVLLGCLGAVVGNAALKSMRSQP